MCYTCYNAEHTKTQWTGVGLDWSVWQCTSSLRVAMQIRVAMHLKSFDLVHYLLDHGVGINMLNVCSICNMNHC